MNLPKIEVVAGRPACDGLFVEIDSLQSSGEPLAEWLCQHWESESLETPDVAVTPDITAWRRRGKKAAFLSRALSWVRLSDRLISREERHTHRTIVFSRVDLANETLQRDVAKLIAFHRTQHIARTFVLTTENASTTQLIPELRVMLGATSDQDYARCA